MTYAYFSEFADFQNQDYAILKETYMWEVGYCKFFTKFLIYILFPKITFDFHMLKKVLILSKSLRIALSGAILVKYSRKKCN